MTFKETLDALVEALQVAARARGKLCRVAEECQQAHADPALAAALEADHAAMDRLIAKYGEAVAAAPQEMRAHLAAESGFVRRLDALCLSGRALEYVYFPLKLARDGQGGAP
jgi:hypothetical protein